MDNPHTPLTVNNYSPPVIAIEGWECAGKTSLAADLAASLSAESMSLPGGTDAGDAIRAILASDIMLSHRAEALLHAASDWQATRKLRFLRDVGGRDGPPVVLDRADWSWQAYQGAGQQLGFAWLADQHPVLEPDLYVLLHIRDWSTAWTRFANRYDLSGREPDRVERRDAEYHRRVWGWYDRVANWKISHHKLDVHDNNVWKLDRDRVLHIDTARWAASETVGLVLNWLDKVLPRKLVVVNG